MFETLDDVRKDAQTRLAGAMEDRRSPMHTPVVATADADARVMVLRHFAPWSLRFHTDTRAPKVAVIARNPQIGVLFYDKAAKVQIRVRGQARVESEGAVAQAAWEASDNFARRCYLGDGPGTLAAGPASGLPEAFEGVEPSDAELAPARANFAVLLVEIHQLDWFHLAHDGHRRAVFDRATGAAQWVTP